MKKVLVVHDLNYPGGLTCVAAWVLQALVGGNDVSVLTWHLADLSRINRYYGTSLNQTDFDWYTVDPVVKRAVSLMPLRLAELSNHVLYRKARRLNEAKQFDVVFCAMNEIDIGVRAIQYIHFPWAYWPRPDRDLHWYHLAPLMHAYRKLSASISGYRRDRAARNLTLVNSDWTGRHFEDWYGVQPRTLYPPVPGGFPDVPFEERERGFVCIGRIAPEKEIDKLVQILAGVRARGHDIKFHIVGHLDSESYMKHLAAMAEPHGDWISFHYGIPRDEMVRLVAQNRYGIHGMVGEHFGIAPAELQRAGCITFVPDDGGPVEIVGRDERVIYHSVDDAIAKIDRALSDRDLEAALLRDLDSRAQAFTEERFMQEIRDVVESFDSASPRLP